MEEGKRGRRECRGEKGERVEGEMGGKGRGRREGRGQEGREERGNEYVNITNTNNSYLWIHK